MGASSTNDDQRNGNGPGTHNNNSNGGNRNNGVDSNAQVYGYIDVFNIAGDTRPVEFYPMTVNKVMIGREHGCEIRLSNLRISRKQCTLEVGQPGETTARLENLTTKPTTTFRNNGIAQNQHVILSSGDRFRLYDQELRFRAVDPKNPSGQPDPSNPSTRLSLTLRLRERSHSLPADGRKSKDNTNKNQQKSRASTRKSTANCTSNDGTSTPSSSSPSSSTTPSTATKRRRNSQADLRISVMDKNFRRSLKGKSSIQPSSSVELNTSQQQQGIYEMDEEEDEEEEEMQASQEQQQQQQQQQQIPTTPSNNYNLNNTNDMNNISNDILSTSTSSLMNINISPNVPHHQHQHHHQQLQQHISMADTQPLEVNPIEKDLILLNSPDGISSDLMTFDSSSQDSSSYDQIEAEMFALHHGDNLNNKSLSDSISTADAVKMSILSDRHSFIETVPSPIPATTEGRVTRSSSSTSLLLSNQSLNTSIPSIQSSSFTIANTTTTNNNSNEIATPASTTTTTETVEISNPVHNITNTLPIPQTPNNNNDQIILNSSVSTPIINPNDSNINDNNNSLNEISLPADMFSTPTIPTPRMTRSRRATATQEETEPTNGNNDNNSMNDISLPADMFSTPTIPTPRVTRSRRTTTTTQEEPETPQANNNNNTTDIIPNSISTTTTTNTPINLNETQDIGSSMNFLFNQDKDISTSEHLPEEVEQLMNELVENVDQNIGSIGSSLNTPQPHNNRYNENATQIIDGGSCEEEEEQEEEEPFFESSQPNTQMIPTENLDSTNTANTNTSSTPILSTTTTPVVISSPVPIRRASTRITPNINNTINSKTPKSTNRQQQQQQQFVDDVALTQPILSSIIPTTPASLHSPSAHSIAEGSSDNSEIFFDASDDSLYLQNSCLADRTVEQSGIFQDAEADIVDLVDLEDDNNTLDNISISTTNATNNTTTSNNLETTNSSDAIEEEGDMSNSLINYNNDTNTEEEEEANISSQFIDLADDGDDYIADSVQVIPQSVEPSVPYFNHHHHPPSTPEIVEIPDDSSEDEDNNLLEENLINAETTNNVIAVEQEQEQQDEILSELDQNEADVTEIIQTSETVSNISLSSQNQEIDNEIINNPVDNAAADEEDRQQNEDDDDD